MPLQPTEAPPLSDLDVKILRFITEKVAEARTTTVCIEGLGELLTSLGLPDTEGSETLICESVRRIAGLTVSIRSEAPDQDQDQE